MQFNELLTPLKPRIPQLSPCITCLNWQWYKKLLLAFTSLCVVNSYSLADSVQTPAMESRLASKALLTDSARAGDRLVAVGANGNIIYSIPAQNGKIMDWQQAKVPTQRLLTTVTFINDREGWAGGHDTLILHTSDGGENWVIQYEDPIPDGDVPKPVLDIAMTDKLHGIAVGAFSLLLETSDGGNTWKSVNTRALYDRLNMLGQEPEPHFTAISQLNRGDSFLIVGELGTALVYSPGGPDDQVWHVVKSPYEGSFFDIYPLSSGNMLVYGLRGHFYRLSDMSDTWGEIRTDTTANIHDCIELPDGSVIAVGSAGTILQVDQGASVAKKLPYSGFDGFTSVQQNKSNGDLLLFGSAGAQSISLQARTSDESQQSKP